jgi:hypothetical protein
MLHADGPDSTRRASQALQAGHLAHFYDPRRRVGKAVAPRLGAGRAVVWDVYLYFLAGSRWEEPAPSPADWAHQLDAKWADVARFRWEEDLTHWLHRVTEGPAAEAGLET